MAESRKIDEPVTFSTFLLFACFFSFLRVLSENENESDLISFVSSEKLLSFDFFILAKEFTVREGLNGKKTFSFGHCPNEGGGCTHARIFWPFFKKCIFGQ